MAELQFIIELLNNKHDRAAFSCGNAVLDTYLHKQAGQDARKRVAVPFVITPDHITIAGFYTLSQYAIDLGDVPTDLAQKLPKYPKVPVTLLGRLAVGTQFRGQGLGRRLLVDALYRSLQSGRQAASAAVIVDAKDDEALSFYRKYGFLELPRIERRLVLSMGTIEELFSQR